MNQNIGQLLTRRAYRDPELEAVYDAGNGKRFSYSQLNANSNRTANAFTDLGLGKGDAVGLLLLNSVEYLESFFAAAKTGLVVVPLNWRLVADELVFILNDAGVKLLLFSDDFSEVASELRRRGTTGITHWIQVDGDSDSRITAYHDWTGRASDTEPEPTAAGDDLLFIMYTSGTTGLPKGVMQSHNTLLWSLFTIATTSDFHYKDRYLNSLPMFHVGALTPVISCVFVGNTLVIMRTFDPVVSWEIIHKEKITTTLMVPAMLQFMLAAYKPGECDIATLRWVMSGAAPVPVSLIEAYAEMGIEVHQVYGLTATCGPACLISPDDAIPRAGSTGKAFYFTEVRVVDSDGKDCRPGEPGEVLVKGPHLMLGYWNQPEATAETIVDGWLHTGDVATMDGDGFVTIVDRLKDMLISGGENVYPAEIEQVLLANEKIADAGVIGIPSAKWGESPLAVIVRRDANLTSDSVIQYSRDKLAPFKTVKAVEFVDEIPRNPSGKILKRALRELFSYAAPE